MKYLIVLLAVAGIYVSSRALQVHYLPPGAALPCAVSQRWDCGEVNHGNYSVFPPKSVDEIDENGNYVPNKPHVPVALVGVVGYSLMIVVALLGWMRIVREMATIGFFCAAFLSYTEAFLIHKWCIYCVWSQGIMTTILVVSVIAAAMKRSRRKGSFAAGLLAED